jgi:hypothetical protein
VSSFVDALSANESTGSLVTQVCDVARKYLKGEAMADEDRTSIIADISKARGWKGPSAKSRTSECNIVLKAYADLPEAIDALRTKAKRCQWHDSMKLARRINAGDSISKAVAFALKAGSSGERVSPSGRTAGALKAWFKAEPRKQKAILEACALLGIKLGVKLDA